MGKGFVILQFGCIRFLLREGGVLTCDAWGELFA